MKSRLVPTRPVRVPKFLCRPMALNEGMSEVIETIHERGKSMPAIRKSTKYKQMTGSLRPDRDTALVEDIKATGSIEMPASLSAREITIWQHAVDAAPANLLKQIDQAQLHVWVSAYAVVCECAEDIAASGAKIKLPNGYLQPNPSIASWAKASTVMQKASAALGFDPASRMRVKSIDTGPPARSPFVTFLSDKEIQRKYKAGEIHPLDVEQLRHHGRDI